MVKGKTPVNVGDQSSQGRFKKVTKGKTSPQTRPDKPRTTVNTMGDGNAEPSYFTALRRKHYSSTATRIPAEAQKNNPEFVEQTTAAVASQLHDMWRAGRQQPDGTYEPRWKDDGDGGQVDIANTPYRDLPAKWQAENNAAAHGAVQAVLTHNGNIEQAAADIHTGWLERNGEWAEPHQKLAYEDLTEEEKEKDRVVARAAWQTVLHHSPSAT